MVFRRCWLGTSILFLRKHFEFRVFDILSGEDCAQRLLLFVFQYVARSYCHEEIQNGGTNEELNKHRETTAILILKRTAMVASFGFSFV